MENLNLDSIDIRIVRTSDAGELARLMGDLGYPATTDQMQMRLQRISKDADYETFVAEISDNLVGMIGVRMGMGYERDGLYAQIITLVVDANRRGKGIGKLLVGAAEKWVREKNADKLIVTTAIHRTETHRFYESGCGLQKTGYRFAKEF